MKIKVKILISKADSYRLLNRFEEALECYLKVEKFCVPSTEFLIKKGSGSIFILGKCLIKVKNY